MGISGAMRASLLFAAGLLFWSPEPAAARVLSRGAAAASQISQEFNACAGGIAGYFPSRQVGRSRSIGERQFDAYFPRTRGNRQSAFSSRQSSFARRR